MNERTATNDLPTRIRLLRELIIVAVGYGVYSQVRGLASNRVVDAFYNGYRVVQIEKDLGIFKEVALQTLILPHNALVDLFNVIYVYGLFPLLIPTAAWLFIKKPDVYLLARNAFLISGFIGVIFFIIVPTAPPRLIGMGLVDTLGQSLTPTYEALPGVNHFAAVPSMHVGWNFLTAVAIYMAATGFRLRWIVLILPVVMLFSTVITGNHYFLDGMLGIVVAAIGLWLAVLLKRYGERRELARAMAEVTPEESDQAPSFS